MEFTAVLYLPKTAPFDMYDSYYSRKAQVKLYVRRVFITDEMEDFLPKYLSFLVGLVDSDSLPLNVSREMLQQHASLKTIKKKLVRKALDMIKRLADAEKTRRSSSGEDGEENAVDEETDALADKYLTFWKEFGKALKLGIIEDATNRNRLAKLMRFYTSKSGDTLTDLEEYVGRMKEGQKHIYFLTGIWGKVLGGGCTVCLVLSFSHTPCVLHSFIVALNSSVCLPCTIPPTSSPPHQVHPRRSWHPHHSSSSSLRRTMRSSTLPILWMST